MGALVVPGVFSPIAEEGKAEDDRNRRNVHPYRTRCASAGTIIADIQSLLTPRLLSHSNTQYGQRAILSVPVASIYATPECFDAINTSKS